MKSSARFRVAFVACIALATFITAPAEAQRTFEPLFDKFNVSAQFSWVDLSTEIGLDSETLGTGTTLKFEDQLGLASSKAVPTLAFEWQIARKHRLAVRWQDITRGSTAQALTEIQWGDEIIPVDAGITLAFDMTQYFIDYTYYPWVKEKWALGFGLGIRWMDLKAELQWEEATLGMGFGLIVPTGDPAKGTGADRWVAIPTLGWVFPIGERFAIQQGGFVRDSDQFGEITLHFVLPWG